MFSNGDFMGSFMGFTGMYPLVICYIANWKMAIKIVDLPGIYPLRMVIVHSYVSLREGH